MIEQPHNSVLDGQEVTGYYTEDMNQRTLLKDIGTRTLLRPAPIGWRAADMDVPNFRLVEAGRQDYLSSYPAPYNHLAAMKEASVVGTLTLPEDEHERY